MGSKQVSTVETENTIEGLLPRGSRLNGGGRQRVNKGWAGSRLDRPLGLTCNDDKGFRGVDFSVPRDSVSLSPTPSWK